MAYNLETPSITSSRGYQSSHLVWVDNMRNDVNRGTFRVHGRIIDTGANYIVEGWKIDRVANYTKWVRIPCQNLPTAQILLISVMDKELFNTLRQYSTK